MKNTTSNLEGIQVVQTSFECTITADVSLFGFNDGKLKILLTKRTVGNNECCWLLPGGVMENEETLEQCAAKVLTYLTGIENVHMEQVKSYSKLNRHKIKRVVTVSFYALIQPENHPIEQKVSVTETKWFDLKALPMDIGFDHEKIMSDAYSLLKQNLRQHLLFGELLPEAFTLNQLQTLYEVVLDEQFDKRNFRKKFFQLKILKNTGEIKKGVKGGPYLYRKANTSKLNPL